MSERNAVLISTRYDQLHDDAFVREQLRGIIESIENVSLVEADDYATPDLETAAVLVTYIAKTAPGEAEVVALRRFLERGGRWFAIHTSNAVPAGCQLPLVLGSRFVTHPPYGPIQVEVTKPGDVLLAGIEAFDVEDELYVCEQADDLEVLLHARFGGDVREVHVEMAEQPLMYRRRVGAGQVLYLALGHSNPSGIVMRGETVGERHGSWSSPVFQELVRRGIGWAVHASPAS